MGKTEEDSAKLNELQKELETKKTKCAELDDKYATLKEIYEREKKQHKEAEESAVAYLDQIEELTHKLNVSENKFKALESNNEKDTEKANQINDELMLKMKRISELEDEVLTKTRDMKSLEGEL